MDPWISSSSQRPFLRGGVTNLVIVTKLSGRRVMVCGSSMLSDGCPSVNAIVRAKVSISGRLPVRVLAVEDVEISPLVCLYACGARSESCAAASFRFLYVRWGFSHDLRRKPSTVRSVSPRASGEKARGVLATGCVSSTVSRGRPTVTKSERSTPSSGRLFRFLAIWLLGRTAYSH